MGDEGVTGGLCSGGGRVLVSMSFPAGFAGGAVLSLLCGGCGVVVGTLSEYGLGTVVLSLEGGLGERCAMSSRIDLRVGG